MLKLFSSLTAEQAFIPVFYDPLNLNTKYFIYLLKHLLGLLKRLLGLINHFRKYLLEFCVLLQLYPTICINNNNNNKGTFKFYIKIKYEDILLYTTPFVTLNKTILVFSCIFLLFQSFIIYNVIIILHSVHKNVVFHTISIHKFVFFHSQSFTV